VERPYAFVDDRVTVSTSRRDDGQHELLAIAPVRSELGHTSPQVSAGPCGLADVQWAR